MKQGTTLYTHTSKSRLPGDFVGELTGPFYPDGLTLLNTFLRNNYLKTDINYLVKKGNIWQKSGEETDYFALSTGYKSEDGKEFTPALKFRNANLFSRKVFGEMMILIPRYKNYWLFFRRPEHSAEVYFWGYSEVEMDKQIHDYVQNLERWKNES